MVQAWNQHCRKREIQKFKPHDTNLFGAAKRITKERPHYPPLVNGNETFFTTEEKCEVLAKNFEAVHKQNQDLGDPDHDAMVEQTVNDFMANEQNFVTPIEQETSAELQGILRTQ